MAKLSYGDANGQFHVGYQCLQYHITYIKQKLKCICL
jgi:hypothetical protein